MIVFPNCKINLGLRILRKRNDGYHDLETIFYPIPLHDILEIIASSVKKTSISTSGFSLPIDPAENICSKAWQLLQRDFPDLPPVAIHLHKAIPSGAGLGGGSADAAFFLKLVNDKFNLGLTDIELMKFALQLGSDCPFFINNTPCYATARGEQLEPIQLDLDPYKIVLVNPGIHVPTGKAFEGITPSIPSKSVRSIIRQPIPTWREELINDFETALFQQYPGIRAIKEQLYSKGAIYASMSGSGSTVYGLFEKGKEAELDFPASYMITWLKEERPQVN